MGAPVVSEEECERMQSQLRDGHTLQAIADMNDRGWQTAECHALKKCHHYVDYPKQDGVSDEEIFEAVRELADELERIPSSRDWEKWPDRVVSADYLWIEFGPWGNVLEQVGYPPLENAPRFIREKVYQNPELCEVKM